MKSTKSIYVFIGICLMMLSGVFFQNCSRPNFTSGQGQQTTASIEPGPVICTNNSTDPADCVPANENKSCFVTVSPIYDSKAPSYLITIQNHETTKENYYDRDINGGGPSGQCRRATLRCEEGKLYFGNELYNQQEVFSGCLEIQM